MKVRLIGTEEEFKQVTPVLEKKRQHFDSWRKPQKGNNPKYKDNPQLLQYLEMDTETFNKLISGKL